MASRPWRGFRCVAICRCLFNQSIGLLRVRQTFLLSLCIHATLPLPFPSRVKSPSDRATSKTSRVRKRRHLLSVRYLILLFYILCIFGKGIYIFIYMYVYRMRVVLRVATCGEPTSVLRISLPRHIHRGLVGSSIVWYGVEQRRLS